MHSSILLLICAALVGCAAAPKPAPAPIAPAPVRTSLDARCHELVKTMQTVAILREVGVSTEEIEAMVTRSPFPIGPIIYETHKNPNTIYTSCDQLLVSLYKADAAYAAELAASMAPPPKPTPPPPPPTRKKKK
jgi:hypothetical protein